MKRYFGDENPELPKEMFLEIFKKLTPSKRVKLEVVNKDWQKLIRNKTLYYGLGLRSYDELKSHALSMKSFFGRYMFNKIINGDQKIVSTECMRKKTELPACTCRYNVSNDELTWHMLYKVDQEFQKVEGKIKDGFDGYLTSDWAIWCYEEVAGPVMDFMRDVKDRIEFCLHCEKIDSEIPNFYALSLRETYAINEALWGTPKGTEIAA